MSEKYEDFKSNLWHVTRNFHLKIEHLVVHFSSFKLVNYFNGKTSNKLDFTWKERPNSFKKWPSKLWWISSKIIKEVGNITTAATFYAFKSFLQLSYKNTQLIFFVTALFNIFMLQTLMDVFWGYTKIRVARFVETKRP